MIKQLHGRMTMTSLVVTCLTAASLYGQPTGFATFGPGTTGGAGGDTVVVTTRNELAAYVDHRDPYVIMVRDTIEMVAYERMDVLSNKSIIGMGNDATIRFGGFEIKGDNVIFQNLLITDSYDGDWDGKTHSTDGITVYGENVWIDHCEFSACADGLVDITCDNGKCANYVTISFCKFGNHNKVILIGSSDGQTEARNMLKTTFHHNWFDGTWERGLNQRMPRARFGDIHLYNNYFEGIDSYCSAARFESDLVIESNFYRSSSDPYFIDDIGKGLKDPEIVAKNNFFEFASGRREESGTAFDPGRFYTYVPDTVLEVPARTINEAGRFNRTVNTKPVAVNDTVLLTGASRETIDVRLNDYDEDGDTLYIARIVSVVEGFGFVRNGQVEYLPPRREFSSDTLVYELVDTQGGTDTATVFLLTETTSTEVPGIVGVEFAINPNPVFDSGWLSIQTDDAFESSEIRLQTYTSTGQIVSTVVPPKVSVVPGDSRTIPLNTSDLSPGIYIITGTIGRRVVTRKFIVGQ